MQITIYLSKVSICVYSISEVLLQINFNMPNTKIIFILMFVTWVGKLTLLLSWLLFLYLQNYKKSRHHSASDCCIMCQSVYNESGDCESDVTTGNSIENRNKKTHVHSVAGDIDDVIGGWWFRALYGYPTRALESALSLSLSFFPCLCLPLKGCCQFYEWENSD